MTANYCTYNYIATLFLAQATGSYRLSYEDVIGL